MTIAQAEKTIARLDAQMDSGKHLRPAQERQYTEALDVWMRVRAAR